MKILKSHISMDTEWERVNQLFHEAMEHADEERADYIARACQNDPALQREVQSLIAADERDDGFFDKPALGKSLFRRFGGWQGEIIDALKAGAGAASPAADRMVGKLLDEKYEIEALCGRGGMGAVYRATHVGTGRRVAVKVIAPELAGDSQFIERFRREARTIGLLRHPNIVNVTDFGVSGAGDDTIAYLVMEFLEGKTLAEQLKTRQPLPIDEAIAILWQTCAAMDEAHRLGILHRDLKPENIWLEPGGANGGNGPNVKVLDFGIARLQENFPTDDFETQPEFGEWALRRQPFSITEDETLPLNSNFQQPSRFSSVMGTPKYMSPEQCRGERLDKSSDIYSLGVIAYQMLTGEPPFTGTPSELLNRHREAAPAPLREKRRNIPVGVDEAVRQALAKDKGARPATAGAFAFQLQLHSQGNRWLRLQTDALISKYRWQFVGIALRLQGKVWLFSLLALFATLKMAGMSAVLSVATFGLLWLIIAAITILGQNSTTAALSLTLEKILEQTQDVAEPETKLRAIVASARRRRDDLARAAFRVIIPPLICEGLSVEAAKQRWAAMKPPIRRQIGYALFRRILAFALTLTAAQQILIASAFTLDRGRDFNTPQVFLVHMNNTVFFWLPIALLIWIVAFNLSLKSALEQFMLYHTARKALGEIPLERWPLFPARETRLVQWREYWKTYAPTCAIVVLIIGFHLSKFPWMERRLMDGDLYSVKATNVSGVPVPLWPIQSDPNMWPGVHSLAMTRYLIEKGANVNANSSDQIWTPLTAALSTCSIETARLLIERGADVHAREFSNPMMIAISQCPEAVDLLLASGVDVNERTRYGTPLLIAARYQWKHSGQVLISQAERQSLQGDAVETLIEKGADPNARDDEGRNALMAMSLEPRPDNDVEMILEMQRITRASRQQLQRSDKAVELIGETLLDAGCDVNAVDKKGRTPLIYAVASERRKVVELLIKRGANISARDRNGESALDWAIKTGNEEIIRLLS